MRLKWVFGIAALLILLLSLGIWLRLSRYDYNAFKPYLARLAKQATGRALTLVGDIHFKPGLRPALTVEDVHFQNAPWGTRPNAIDVQRIELQISLLSLLRHTLDVKRLVLIEPSILLEIDDQGGTNLAFQKPDSQSKATPHLEGLGVNHVQIKNGVFTIRDARSKRHEVVTQITLKATAKALDRPLTLDLQGNFRGHHMTTTGTLGSLIALLKAEQPWPFDLHMRLRGLTLHTNGSIQDPLTPRGMSLDMLVEGQDFTILEAFFDKPIPLPGPFRLAGHMVDRGPTTLVLQKADLLVGANRLSGTYSTI